MRQALHIFKKDVRHLRYEIGLLLAIALAFAITQIRSETRSTGSGWTELVLIAVAMLVIGRVILAEEIPGERQFWVTRPYHWRSLLGAKLLFIGTFVSAPILAAQVAILIADRLPLVPNLPGLVWSQILLFIAIFAPSAGLATLTSSLGLFVFIELGLLALVAGSQELLPLSRATQFSGEGWLRAGFGIVVLLAVSCPVLYWQFRKRRTATSRYFAAAGIVLGAATILVMPSTAALAAQLWFSAQPSLGSSISVQLGPLNQDGWRIERSPTALYIPIAISGFPDGTTVIPDDVAMTLESRDGKVSYLNLTDLTRHTEGNGRATLRARYAIDPDFVNRNKDELFTVHGTAYLTLFGNPKSTTIAVAGRPTNVQDGLQCYAANGHSEWDVFCRSAFRWPRRLIYAQLGSGSLNAFTHSVSYSPFPATLGINPIETHWASAYAYGPPITVRSVTIASLEPLVHVRRRFLARDVRLSELAFPKKPMGVPPTSLYVP